MGSGKWEEKWGVYGLRDGFYRSFERIGRANDKFSRPVPGWGTSAAMGRSAGVASLATGASRSISRNCSRRRCSGAVSGRCVGIGPRLKVVQDPPHHRWVLDRGNHVDGAAALITGLDVDLEHALEALRPGHRGAALSRGLGLGGLSLATACRGHVLA